MTTFRPLVLFLALTSFVLGACPASKVASPPEGTPRLVLFLVVDQLRADYLVRFRPYFSDGFARLLEESVSFTHTSHGHALTKTAPGHATLASGTHPSRHGVVGNSWYDRELGQAIDSDEDWSYDPDRAPTRLLVSTLGDWLKSAYPKSRVFSASMKSRAAIMSAGHTADAAFWYDDETGRFVTSDYYLDETPDWLEAFHRDPLPERLFGSSWHLLPEVAAAIEPLGLEQVDRGIQHKQMPRPIGGSTTFPNSSYYWNFLNESPFGDAYVGELAWSLIQSEQLGRGDSTDLLALSFSSLDYIGHRYGPNSAEVLDTLVRLDRVLGDLLSRLDEAIGLEHVVVSLTSDHGVAPIAEYANGRRFWLEERSCLQRASEALDSRFGEARWLEYDGVFDRQVLASEGIELARAEAVLAEAIEACPGVEKVWTSSELSGETDTATAQLYARSFFPGRSPDLEIQVEPRAMTSTAITNHGTPYDYDRRVPWLLRLPGTSPAEIDTPILTVDIAPTVAELVALEPTDPVDGQSRLGQLGKQPTAANAAARVDE